MPVPAQTKSNPQAATAADYMTNAAVRAGMNGAAESVWRKTLVQALAGLDVCITAMILVQQIKSAAKRCSALLFITMAPPVG